MKKLTYLLKTMLAAFILCTLMPINGGFSVSADSYYPMACSTGEFEVSYINDDGSFSKISCHGSFNEAKKKMKEK